ncbi:MAG: nuclease-related domain-containing protein [Brevinema sp.]
MISIILLVIFIYIMIKITSKFPQSYESPQELGERGEKNLLYYLLQLGIDKEDIFHDLYVPKNNGTFSQIDLVVLTKVGIVVIEVKNYSGWIFGNGNQTMWTKVLAYGQEKYRFYNPIKQNISHINILKQYLRKYGKLPFYSLVVFDGNCLLKKIDCIPNGTHVIKISEIPDALYTILNNNAFISYHYDEIRTLLLKSVEYSKDQFIRDHHANNTIKYIKTARDKNER